MRLVTKKKHFYKYGNDGVLLFPHNTEYGTMNTGIISGIIALTPKRKFTLRSVTFILLLIKDCMNGSIFLPILVSLFKVA